jgi:glyoxalase family protein
LTPPSCSPPIKGTHPKPGRPCVPGGVLFEIATDTPGFDVDEPLLELGRSLKLPPWMEPSREAIEGAAARIQLPGENNPALAGR